MLQDSKNQRTIFVFRKKLERKSAKRLFLLPPPKKKHTKKQNKNKNKNKKQKTKDKNNNNWKIRGDFLAFLVQ